jgi:hypothetical protein
MKAFILFPVLSLLVTSICFRSEVELPTHGSVIARGQMPNLVNDKLNRLHLVYGSGDSIMYTVSTDAGLTFSKPSLISVLPELAASHTRGPQIAATSNGLLVTACTNAGDIYSYVADKSGTWTQSSRVNDMDTVAKENLMSLAADGDHAFAVWLDLRDKHNKIYGAKSLDGGKTWSKNIMIYTSPDSTVCECCRPSIAMRGNNINVMFRNWLNGNRDLHLIQSSDGGKTFGPAQKLGNDSWALEGCPMDGGGVALDTKGNANTVWNRKGIIYAAQPGHEEVSIGQGRSCTITSTGDNMVYAWVENGNVVVRTPSGNKKTLGKGQLPVIRAINNKAIICVWEHDKQIYKAVLEI